MQVSPHGSGSAQPAAAYVLGGQRFEAGSREFADAIAQAHAAHHRPHCMCQPGSDGRGVEMYVARLAGTPAGFIVKRMPCTGSLHAPDCPSYEPPAEASGLGQLLGSAITEDPATGETILKLDFPMSKIVGRSEILTTGEDHGSVTSSGTRLSLRGLLHYLWDQAELTRWQPGFAGKRSWGTVRKHLLLAAEHKTARGRSLRARLYVPEVFSVDEREAIQARRTTHWSQAIAAPGKPQRLMLLIAEVKEIVPARYGFKAVLKHVPDLAFALDEQLYRRLGHRFESALALWAASEDLHMVMIATFSVSVAGVPTLMELSLMPVTRHWLPVENGFEKQLIERLVTEGRSFVKALRYNLGAQSTLACATLTDCDGSAPWVLVVHPGADGDDRFFLGCDASVPVWWWNPSNEVMPSLPPRRPHRPQKRLDPQSNPDEPPGALAQAKVV